MGQVRSSARVATKPRKPRPDPQMQIRWASYDERMLVQKVARKRGFDSAQDWIRALVRAEIARAVEEGLE